MAILNFKEIPEAHLGSGVQDTFELFARDFLQFIGYKIITDPDRGADGGADLIVEEKRTGIGGETTIRWLVSCKHKAHSGKAVSPTDEINIRDRVDAKNCNGFIGFYSTIASSGLTGILGGVRGVGETQIFDHEKIESKLLHSDKGLQISERYFPISLSLWRTENPKPAKIFATAPSLKCKICDINLFDQDDKGVVTVWTRDQMNHTGHEFVEHISWTCRGRCDERLIASMRIRKPNLTDGWEDISDVMTPTIFIKWVMAILNQQRNGTEYSDEAFTSLKLFMLRIFPHISRNLTTQEEELIENLLMLPSYLGGLGQDN